MRLEVYKSLWGVLDVAGGSKPLNHGLLSGLKAQGYAGVEVPIKTVMHYGVERFDDLLYASGLKMILMAFSDGELFPGWPPQQGVGEWRAGFSGRPRRAGRAAAFHGRVFWARKLQRRFRPASALGDELELSQPQPAQVSKRPAAARRREAAVAPAAAVTHPQPCPFLLFPLPHPLRTRALLFLDFATRPVPGRL